jgi:transcriptional regulator with XRE-family HTH domain
MDISVIIGENLKRIRLERNLSLGQLSLMSGVSKVMLSQIEKGTSNPSVNTVWKIADSLQIPYTALLERDIDGGTVISSKDIPVQTLDDDSGYLRCYYHHSKNRSFELFKMNILPGGVHVSQGHGERTDEYTLVIEGTLTITLDDGNHILHTGDAVNFHSNKEHRYFNSGSDELKLMIINYYR